MDNVAYGIKVFGGTIILLIIIGIVSPETIKNIFDATMLTLGLIVVLGIVVWLIEAHNKTQQPPVSEL